MPQKPLRILIPTLDYPPIEGGLGTLTLETSRALARLGHEVTVFAPYMPNHERHDDSEPVRVVRWHGYNYGPARWFPFMQQGQLWTEHKDLILAINHFYGGMMGRRAWQRSGTPYVTFAYAYEFLKYRRVPMLARTLHHIYDDAACVVAISAFTRHALIDFGVEPEHVAVAYPGVRIQPTVTDAAWDRVRTRLDIGDRPFILAAGRLIARKGFRTLVDAFAIVRRQGIDAALVIAGRGPEESRVASRIRMNRLGNDVCLAGYLPEEELAALYSRCAFFALATREESGGQVEGFGLVFLEAASYGKAAIGGRGGGVDEAIADGETGLLVDGCDAEAIARAMVALLRDEHARCRLGSAAMARAKTFTWKRFAEETLEAAGFSP